MTCCYCFVMPSDRETLLSALSAICTGIHGSPMHSTPKRPVSQNIDVFFAVYPNNQLNEQTVSRLMIMGIVWILCNILVADWLRVIPYQGWFVVVVDAVVVIVVQLSRPTYHVFLKNFDGFIKCLVFVSKADIVTQFQSHDHVTVCGNIHDCFISNLQFCLLDKIPFTPNVISIRKGWLIASHSSLWM